MQSYWTVHTVCIPDFGALRSLCGAAVQLYPVRNDTAPYFSQTASYIHTETNNRQIYIKDQTIIYLVVVVVV